MIKVRESGFFDFLNENITFMQNANLNSGLSPLTWWPNGQKTWNAALRDQGFETQVKVNAR